MNGFGLARIGRDAEVRYTPKQEAVLNLSLAFSRMNKGEKSVQWVEASLWGKRAESLAPYLKKGGLVSVTLEDLHIETYKSANGEGSKLTARIIGIDLAGAKEDKPKAGGFDDDAAPF